MTRKKVIAICLDALDAELCNSMIEEGKLSGLAELISKSASFSLEHGARGLARYTGLTWEHFSSGKSPESSRRGSVICFDKDRYSAYQQNATQSPFVADTDVRTLVFDVPYFKLEAAPEVTGIVGWGGHDTGCELRSQPSSLLSEIESQFGQSPDNSALNTTVYPDKEAVQTLGDYLVSTAIRRTEIIEWLLTSKYADFELALPGYGEPHDAIELLAYCRTIHCIITNPQLRRKLHWKASTRRLAIACHDS